MKVLFLGEISPGQTSYMRMRALTRLGHEVKGINTIRPWLQASWLSRQIQRRLQVGRVIDIINDEVLKHAREFRPDLVWAEKQEFLRAETLTELHRLRAKTVHFTPDPYFTIAWKRTRIMDETISQFNLLLYCKSYEKRSYEELGKPVFYMPLGYCDEAHRPMPTDDAQWSCAIGFLGGWEPLRERALHAVAGVGADLKIRGAYWDFLSDGQWTLRRQIILKQLAGDEHFRIHYDSLLAKAWQGGEVYGDDYARALTGARIGIGFLRRTWPDQHTTRSFEIPACGSMLLADRTKEHNEFFEEGVEAEYFGSTEEMLDKIAYYTSNEPARRRIAEAGYRRCIEGRYAYIHRIAAALGHIARA